MTKEADALDKTVIFLAKRDGIDKVLKVIRYSTRLLLATETLESKGVLAGRLKDFEKSVGTSRKAYRLGKWIADVNKLRKSKCTSQEGLLEVAAYGGEAVYYFCEQITWLSKAGLLHNSHAARLSKVSACAELIGYVGSISLSCICISGLLEQERLLLADLLHSKGEHEADLKKLQRQLALLRAERLLRVASVVQDCADSLLALHDIRDVQGILASPILLCLCGLISAAVSIHKNWP
ncbi:hypothetical protein WJX73_002142 [Symbiochloris irregularis]|uniref:Uncharacterized protein n=1 Tax=Symbiochloris irregularis TaxID=706552 RepID=A0AAW1NRK2_9CHLO